ncbi:TRAP transporter small permease subunit [Stappia taiwanensis]|uniref:TRAP transporter small permease protein n=1 Tax=Stappia taiwanensis TaxID=992267 RepID=A0A838XNV1_9HYPH|nr:TRAP transporter small permease subunit [Stappia taiwanensis]MBA4611892.1 TRAP transporter small permease subunit [Stappia taiwanensis]GGF03595.1 C4-dicarboxylate ABC transporter [Stappia taiwanensis]
MLEVMRVYVRWVDAFNRRLGRLIMYGIFVMAGILLWSSISKTFFLPSIWTLEVAQFAMVSYYILGGPYSIQLGSNVRMDLFYASWSLKKRAWFDAFTVLLLMFFLGVLLYGGVGSTAYSLGHFGDEPFTFLKDIVVAFLTGGPDAASEKLGYIERSPTAWRPYLWPVKLVMISGFLLMLLQALSELFKDIARIRGEEI